MNLTGNPNAKATRRNHWRQALLAAGLALVASATLTLAPVRAPAAGATDAAGPSTGPQADTDFKVLKWALPRLGDREIEVLLQDVEYAASRYSVSYEFALAVVASEASLPGGIAVGRRRNIDFLRLRSGDRTSGYPEVQDDLHNAISSLAMYLRTEESTTDALTYYWADPELKLNTDSLPRFLQRVREKYNALIRQPETAGAQDYLREVDRFPTPPDDFESELKLMPNLNAQLVRYDVEEQYKEVALYFNPKLTDREATLIARSILTFSMQASRVDPRLVVSVIAAESRFRPRAVSKKGAMGLGQLMPATARSHGIRDPFDPVQNIFVTVKYLEREIARWGNRGNWLDLVLASYNAGAGAVKKYGGVPPYNETAGFVRTVKRYFHQMTG